MEIGEAVVRSIIVHQVGNRLREEPLVLADQCFSISERISNMILSGYLRGIVADKNLCLLTHETDMALNDVVHHTSNFFTEKISFVELSQRLATHLYASTHHPNIAAGDLFVILFDKLRLDGQYRSAVGVYKSESKQQYISAKIEAGEHQLEALTGVNPELIDKGALITEGSGSVYALDRLGNRTKYWLEDFLMAKQIPDEKMKSSIAVSLVEKVREKIEGVNARQNFGREVMALCSERDEVFSSELKQISEQYVLGEVWDAELERIVERKGLMEIDDISIPVNRFQKKLNKTLSRVDLGGEVFLAIPSNLSFEGAEVTEEGKMIRINIVLEAKNG